MHEKRANNPLKGKVSRRKKNKQKNKKKHESDFKRNASWGGGAETYYQSNYQFSLA